MTLLRFTWLMVAVILLSVNRGYSNSLSRRIPCECKDPSRPSLESCMCITLIGGEMCLHSNDTVCECCLTGLVPMCDRHQGCINVGRWEFQDDSNDSDNELIAESIKG